MYLWFYFEIASGVEVLMYDSLCACEGGGGVGYVGVNHVDVNDKIKCTF